MDADTIREWLGAASDSIHQQRDYLTQLDAAIGDADHGANMCRGFDAILEAIGNSGGSLSPGTLLVRGGRAFLSGAGGASGALWNAALKQAGRSLGDVETFGADGLALILEGALSGIVQIGAAAEGDKTIVDALAPASRALRAQLDSGASVEAAIAASSRAAEAGMRATTPLRANKGRASYLGERSIGHQDPGATSTALIVSALQRALPAES